MVSHKHSPNVRQRDQSLFSLGILITELHNLVGKQIAGSSRWQFNSVCLVSATYWELASFPNSQKIAVKAKQPNQRNKRMTVDGSVASTSFHPLFPSTSVVIRTGDVTSQKEFVWNFIYSYGIYIHMDIYMNIHIYVFILFCNN